MSKKALNDVQQIIDTLSEEEKQQVIADLITNCSKKSVREIVTQEELDLIYSTLNEDCQKQQLKTAFVMPATIVVISCKARFEKRVSDIDDWRDTCAYAHEGWCIDKKRTNEKM